MGTWTASKMRTSRRQRACASCGNGIDTGEPYLSYAPGQRTRIDVCQPCAKNKPHYDCDAVRELRAVAPSQA
jgi:predicted RNA-binding Zn-ribbon protein involved in translation (DUF1610 family)